MSNINNIQKKIEEVYETNIRKIEIYKEKNKIHPKIAIINTNLEDEPSQRYIRNKKKKCEQYGIEVEIYEPENEERTLKLIEVLNNSKDVTSIIIQYPFGFKCQNKEVIFSSIKKEKDIDRLGAIHYEDLKNSLPLTADGIYQVVNKLGLKDKTKILFNGNGMTTNKRLFPLMFDEGKFDCRIINSKTPKESVNELIEWSDVIISGIGKKDSLECKDKIVICPSIIKNSDGTFSSDLKDELREYNTTHKVIGSIGLLTTSNLLLRAYKDAEIQQKR